MFIVRFNLLAWFDFRFRLDDNKIVGKRIENSEVEILRLTDC